MSLSSLDTRSPVLRRASATAATRWSVTLIASMVCFGCDPAQVDDDDAGASVDAASAADTGPATLRDAARDDIDGAAADAATAAADAAEPASDAGASSCPRRGIVFEDGFESGGLGTRGGGFRWAESVRSTVRSGGTARTGSASLAMTYEAVPNREDSFTEQRFELGEGYRDLWIQYALYIPANYLHREQAYLGPDQTDNNKGFLYLWSGAYGSPSGPGMGPNLWPSSTGSAGSFYYWMPGRDVHREDIADAIRLSDRGQWVTMTMHYAYESAAGARDGVAEIWRRRGAELTKLYDIQDGDWFVRGQPGFERGYLLGWANSGFAEETTFYIDDFVVATEPLEGCAP